MLSLAALPALANENEEGGELNIPEIVLEHLAESYEWHIATYEATVLAQGSDVVEIDPAHLTATALDLSFGESPVGILVIAVGTWIAGHVDRLCLSPPYIAPQATIQLDIRENNICHGALIAILYTQTAV